MYRFKYQLSSLLVPTRAEYVSHYILASSVLSFVADTTYCLFELVSCAKQENLSWSNISLILHELQLLISSYVFSRVSSEIKK